MTNPALGSWSLTIKTPIGTQEVALHLWEQDGTLVGTAAGAHETVPLRNVVVDGDQLTWSQLITKPMRLNLDFHVTIGGDALTGTSKAGRLPRSKVTGVRRQDA